MKTKQPFDLVILRGAGNVVKTLGADSLVEAQRLGWEEIRMDEQNMGYRISEVRPSNDRCAKLVDVSSDAYASAMERFSLSMQRGDMMVIL